MASISMFGGGFFFSPFTRTYTFAASPVGNLNPLLPGPWSVIINPAGPSGSPGGRWMQLTIWNGVGQNFIQLGIGTAGLETPWQPNGGIGAFRANFDPVPGGGGVDTTKHWDYSFPISLNAGETISVRLIGALFGGLPATLSIEMGVWA